MILYDLVSDTAWHCIKPVFCTHTVLYCIARYFTACTILYDTALHCIVTVDCMTFFGDMGVRALAIVLYCIAGTDHCGYGILSFGIVLFCVIAQYCILCCTVLHCVILQIVSYSVLCCIV